MFSNKKKKMAIQQSEIVVGGKYTTRKAEEYNRLRDNILFLNADGDKKVIQVESAVMHEGKTTLISNLAVCLGLANKKVIAIDLDFRSPKLHHKFEIEMGSGISEYMLDKVDKEGVIKHSKYANVDLITRGGKMSNPSVIFISEKFHELIAELRKEYDYVLLDCAPVLQISDYINILSVSDGVLFVVAYGMTTRNQVADAVKELKKSGANILGSVFTMYDRKRDSDYGYGYGRYYSKQYYGYYSKQSLEEEEAEESANKTEKTDESADSAAK